VNPYEFAQQMFYLAIFTLAAIVLSFWRLI